ncbi:hypothetical protein FRC19_005716, partial [Serendipita sp. 401]
GAQKVTLIVAGCYIVGIAILWNVPYLKYLLYPFKLLTVALHEFSHALAGVLTCAKIKSIKLDPDEGGATRMSGGIPLITLPAGYLGSSFMGACMIACGFNTNASKIASLVLAAIFILALFWARKSVVAWILIFGFAGILIALWLIKNSIGLRFFVLFMGVMSCMYVLWDVVDDTIARKVSTSDAGVFAKMFGCCSSRVWGVVWLIIACIYFALGLIVGLLVFKQTEAQMQEDARHFIPAPGA